MPALSHEDILEAVHQLPSEEQRALALAILQAFAPSPAAPAQRELAPAPNPCGASAMKLRGIAKTETPIDDERLLDESRMERYLPPASHS